MIGTLISLVLDALAVPHCREIVFDAAPFTVCEFARDADVRLLLEDADGVPFGTLTRAVDSLPPGERALMATNAGMYHADQRPVGLFVQNGEERAPLVRRPGPGNFGLVPNGVFWSDGTRVHVTETLAYAAREPDARFATQSGPMLVVDGALHPRFRPDSESRKRRNGVGVNGDAVMFAISDAPVTFHHFARLFRDELGADNALFLDGTVSRIISPDTGRRERGGTFGPIAVVVEDAP